MIKKLLTPALVLGGLALAGPASAAVVGCAGGAGNVATAFETAPIAINAKWQNPPGSMQKILTKTITVGGAPLLPTCLVAHFSSMVRITDNYVGFRVTVDGAAMAGHVNGLAGIAQPTVYTSLSDNNEQFTDPTKTVSHNFFASVFPGVHVVEVWATAGSNIVSPPGPPTVFNPVLTLEYR